MTTDKPRLNEETIPMTCIFFFVSKYYHIKLIEMIWHKMHFNTKTSGVGSALINHKAELLIICQSFMSIK
jgi:hypothetical protein